MKTPIVNIQAPGRVCLFGDHQDYLGLPVIACAIDRHFHLRANPINEKALKILMPNINEKRIIRFDEIASGVPKGDHLMAALVVMMRKGCEFDSGYEIEFRSSVPINAGVSSSSAMMVAWIHFLWKAFGNDSEVDSESLGLWAYEAEVVEQNSPGGKMDQFTIALGNLIQIDTGENFGYQQLGKTLDGMILGESGLPKETISLLGDLKGKAVEAIKEAKIYNPNFILEEASLEGIKNYREAISKELWPYFEAAIGNHIVTKKALEILKAEVIDYPQLGVLMSSHHKYLKENLKITTRLIDDMIDASLSAGAYGAKIVGSGGGGSIVAIAPLDKQTAVINAIKMAGAKDAYSINVTTGTKLVHE